jgi:hypothetical protein
MLSQPLACVLAVFFKQRLCLFQIGRIEPLREPAVNRGRQSVRVAVAAVIAPPASQPHRGAQLEDGVGAQPLKNIGLRPERQTRSGLGAPGA